jgi:hypothetical protein
MLQLAKLICINCAPSLNKEFFTAAQPVVDCQQTRIKRREIQKLQISHRPISFISLQTTLKAIKFIFFGTSDNIQHMWLWLKLILIHQESRCTEKLNLVKFRAPFGEAGLHKKGQTVQNCLQNVQHTPAL